MEKGVSALKAWRTAKDDATKQGPEALKMWLEDQALKKAQKQVSPIKAIRNFCVSCVGNKTEDITNCTAKKCPLYIYRPYQKGENE